MLDKIVFDKEYTATYRDVYHEQCNCELCILFRNHFPKEYPEVITFLSQFGIDSNFPIEICDIGINDTVLKREYMVYYDVKGSLPVPKIHMTIGEVDIIIRNDDIAQESYANTGMQSPFFVIELSGILLSDTKSIFSEAVEAGREIEFSYLGQHFFESRNHDHDWYIYCEETKASQNFSSAKELLEKTILQGCNLNTLWEQISIDCIL